MFYASAASLLASKNHLLPTQMIFKALIKLKKPIFNFHEEISIYTETKAIDKVKYNVSMREKVVTKIVTK